MGPAGPLLLLLLLLLRNAFLCRPDTTDGRPVRPAAYWNASVWEAQYELLLTTKHTPAELAALRPVLRRRSAAPPPPRPVAPAAALLRGLRLCRDISNLPWTYSELRQELRRFLPVYRRRPLQDNVGGMRLSHSFGLWLQLRTSRPKFFIENGVYRGHSTWLVRQALPDVQLFSVDPLCDQVHCDPKATYITGPSDPCSCRCRPTAPFTDFAAVDWARYGVDPTQTIVLFDDHQDALQRLQQAQALGFTRVMVDDNHCPLQGDLYSLKQVCDESGGLALHRYAGEVTADRYRVYRKSNFSQTKTKITLEAHQANRQWLLQALRSYYEFPPVLYHYTMLHARAFPRRLQPVPDALAEALAGVLVEPPIVERRADLPELPSLPLADFLSYNWMCFAELR